MDIAEIIGIVTVIGGTVGVLVTAIAGLINAITSKNKETRDREQSPITASETVGKMSMSLIEKLTEQIDKLDKKVAALDDLLVSYKKENETLKRLIENIFDSLEDKIKNIRWNTGVPKECVEFLEVILVLIKELKDIYEET